MYVFDLNGCIFKTVDLLKYLGTIFNYNGSLVMHKNTLSHKHKKLCLGLAYGRYPIKFMLPEFLSYLGKEGCCVWEAVDISVHQFL